MVTIYRFNGELLRLVKGDLAHKGSVCFFKVCDESGYTVGQTRLISQNKDQIRAAWDVDRDLTPDERMLQVYFNTPMNM